MINKIHFHVFVLDEKSGNWSTMGRLDDEDLLLDDDANSMPMARLYT